ncbi:MAG: IS5 family transposase [Smithella sp.]|nr:IS5 family transposase [Smithella sp.]
MMQTGLFDWQTRFEQLNNGGDPLVKLNAVVNWELFRNDLQQVREKARKSNAGRKPFDVVLMFKVLILQSLYNLSDDAIEFQIRDRLSFMRFLNLTLGDVVPDAKTIWLFREQLTEAEMIKPLFDRFDAFLRKNGFSARKGQIVDASIVPAPRQRNSRDENKQIKDGQVPDDWSDSKRRQKDTDARWTKKNGKNYFGYKNHIQVDAKNKLIREYAVTEASTHDSQVFEELLDEDNSSRDVWADSAYRSKDALDKLEQEGFREHLQRKGCRHKKLTEREKCGNHTRAKVRSRVEHIFGVQAQRAGSLILRAIGLTRATAKIGLRNLAYNIDRFCLLATA